MSVETKVKQRRGAATKTAAVERSLARRKADIAATQSFLADIERRTIRRAARLNRLAERAGMQQRKVRRVVEDGIRKLSQEMAQLPRSGRALRRIQRSEAIALLTIIRKFMKRQRRLQYLLADEVMWRRQIQTRLARSSTIIPLIHAGSLDKLEELLAKRRGKGGKNRAARMLGCLRAQKRPYSHEHHVEIGRKGAAKRWRVKGETNRRAAGTQGAECRFEAI